MKTCTKCLKNLPIERFPKKRNQCKRCRNDYGRNRISNRLLTNTLPLDVRIRLWIHRTTNKKENKFLCRDNLFQLAHEALKKFPYIKFINHMDKSATRGKCARPNSASIDRIDSSKPYSDDNIQVIPLWLNMAKLNKSIDFLVPYLRDFSNRFDQFKKHFSLTEDD